MNTENLSYLEQQIFYSGFTDFSKTELEKILNSGQQSVQYPYQRKIDNEDVIATMNFKQSKQGYYFFNSFDLKIEGEKELKQNFAMKYGNSFTLKEAFNMLHGRAVNKDFIRVGEPGTESRNYNAWAYLDFNEKNKQDNFLLKKIYNYDLQEVLKRYPIVDLENEQSKSDLINTLKKGNRPSVTFKMGEKVEKRSIEAAPKFKSINIYDENGKRILLKDTVAQAKAGKTQSQEETEKPVQDQAEKKSTVTKKSQSNGQPKVSKKMATKTARQQRVR